MGWNGSGEVGNRTPTKKRPSKSTRNFHGIIAGIVVVIGGVLAFLILSNRVDTEPEKPKAKPTKHVAETTAPRVRTVKTDPAQEKTSKQEKKVTPRDRYLALGCHTNECGYVINPPHTKNVVTSRIARTEMPEDRIFSNHADRKIAKLLTHDPGEPLVGGAESIFTRGFERQLRKALESPELILQTDSDEVKELKKSVIEVKAELKEMMNRGEDVREAMIKARNELQQLGLYRAQLQKEIRSVAKKEGMTGENMKLYLEAANRMLENKGAKPISMPRLAVQKFKLDQMKQESSNEENEQ